MLAFTDDPGLRMCGCGGALRPARSRTELDGNRLMWISVWATIDELLAEFFVHRRHVP